MSIFNSEDIKNIVKTSVIENFIKKVINKENKINKNDNHFDMMGQKLEVGDYVTKWDMQMKRWLFFRIINIYNDKIEVSLVMFDKNRDLSLVEVGFFKETRPLIKLDMSLVTFFARRYNL